MKILRIGGVINIWDEIFCKLRVSFDGLVTRKKVFLESIYRFETHIDVVVETLKFHISVSFELCIDDEFIKSWLADIMFQSPHANNFCRLYTFQWWIYPVIWYHSGRVRRLWWILLGWRGFQSVNLIYDWCENFLELFCELHYLFIIVFLVGSHLLLVGLNCSLHDDELFIRLVLHLVNYFSNLAAWAKDNSITEIEKLLWFGAICHRWTLMREQPGKIIVLSMWFGLRKFGKLGLGSRK